MTDYTIKELKIPFKNSEITTDLYSLLYLPDLSQVRPPVPLVIICHGFGSAHYRKMPYAEAFAREGVACLIFDFIGSSPYTLSGGSMEMNSLHLELEELDVIRAYSQTLDDIDPDKIFLMGASLGGVVTTIYAATHPHLVAGMILIYPGFMLADRLKKTFGSEENIIPIEPFKGRIQSVALSKECWGLRLYDLMRKYPGPVLILIGDEDDFVPLSYAKRAEKTFPNAKLIILPGEKHGFRIDTIDSLGPTLVHFVKHPPKEVFDSSSSSNQIPIEFRKSS